MLRLFVSIRWWVVRLAINHTAKKELHHDGLSSPARRASLPGLISPDQEHLLYSALWNVSSGKLLQSPDDTVSMGFLTKLAQLTGALLLPGRCLVCQKPLIGHLLCQRCQPQIQSVNRETRCSCCFEETEQGAISQICAACHRIPNRLSRQRYLWEYEGTVRHFIVTMKYRPSRKLAAEAARVLAAQVRGLFDHETGWDAIIPMPCSPSNYARRLFNPARILAQCIGHELQLPVFADVLLHTGRSSSQATQRESARISNARHSLMAGSRCVKGQSILLIDDVVTTGATSAVAARLLAQKGACKIDLLSLARAHRWHQFRSRIERHL